MGTRTAGGDEITRMIRHDSTAVESRKLETMMMQPIKPECILKKDRREKSILKKFQWRRLSTQDRAPDMMDTNESTKE